MTNANRIREMSDEELAEFLCKFRNFNSGECAGCPAEDFCYAGHTGTLDYVKREELFGDETM